MFTKIQNFFLDLQQKDQETKKRWLVILTSGSMAVIILFWMAYLNFTVKNLGQAQNETSVAFPAIFKNGLRVISERAGLELNRLSANLKELAQKTNSVTIQTDSIKSD